MMSTASRVPVDLFSPVQQASVVDAVLEQVIDLIRAGQLPEGALLPGERQLALAMDASRRTIREAIDVLEQAGVVTVAPGRAGGTRIASIWIPDSLSGSPQELPTDELYQTLEARRVIEPRLVQLAALRGTDADFRIMAETIELQRRNQNDVWRMAEGNVIFHRQLWRAARNPDLEAAMRAVYRRLSGAFLRTLSGEGSAEAAQSSIDSHEETLEVVMRGRPDDVEAVMDRHLAWLERRCEASLGRARIPEMPQFLIGSDADGRSK
jgi:GntR family transcriptional regulator, transcriptional repressor for pyruvate dehydrogenase complex